MKILPLHNLIIIGNHLNVTLKLADHQKIQPGFSMFVTHVHLCEGTSTVNCSSRLNIWTNVSTTSTCFSNNIFPSVCTSIPQTSLIVVVAYQVVCMLVCLLFKTVPCYDIK